MSAPKITEEQMVNLVRNALLVAGNEIGEDGDHWPVINSTIHAIVKDWQDLQVERNVHVELRTHLYANLDKMDEILSTCSDEIKSQAGPKLKKLREIYDAHFTAINDDELELGDEDAPLHVLRAEAIIRTLEDDNG